jgi:hypothetical protein
LSQFESSSKEITSTTVTKESNNFQSLEEKSKRIFEEFETIQNKTNKNRDHVMKFNQTFLKLVEENDILEKSQFDTGVRLGDVDKNLTKIAQVLNAADKPQLQPENLKKEIKLEPKLDYLSTNILKEKLQLGTEVFVIFNTFFI